jgi:hypothetical protein
VLGDLSAVLDEWTAEILATLGRLLRESGFPEPSVEAPILFATIDGIAQHCTMLLETYPLDAVVAALVARYAPAARI